MKLIALALCTVMSIAAAAAQPTHTFEVSKGGMNAFLLDGKPFQIRCGELHFARVPRSYWRHRIKMCKAMGLNAVCAYMFWNYHEMEPGVYDFSGEKDVAEFCRIAQQEGMWVLLRPGPYTCAEWEFGGLPWHLLKNGRIPLRTRDARFMEPAKAYIRRVAKELKDLQITHGGPILMAQDENEYGFFGNDKEYIRELYNTMRESGFDIPIFTCNPAYHLDKGAIPEVLKVVNFPANPKNAFERLREVQPTGPLMCGEYYPAWFDSWGQRHHTKPVENMLKDIDYILSVGGSFSLYMAHGGTSFGWWAGCNPPFLPQTSSYDYEAPISEQGRTTPKFFALRDLLKKHMTPEEAAGLPDPPSHIPVQSLKSDARAEILVANNVKTYEKSDKPRAMEALGQGYGVVAYSCVLPEGGSGMLKAPNLHDQAAVFADCKFLGYLDRRFPERGVEVPKGAKNLLVIVTHMSRYNFGDAMNDSAKGLLPPVTLGGKELTGWSSFGVGPDVAFDPAPKGYEKLYPSGTPCQFKRYKVHFSSRADTYLLVRGWKKGHVWVNGHPLGRFWGIGPTQTMYVPGCWLKKGDNEFVVWDFAGNVPEQGLTFVSEPVLDEMNPGCDFLNAPRRQSEPWSPPDRDPDLRGEFPDTVMAYEIWLGGEPGKGVTRRARRFAFVVDTDWTGKDVAAIGEFEIFNAAGNSVPHSKWKFVSVSSEELSAEDGSADNAIDGQISNYWHSRWSDGEPPPPHYFVIDMGDDVDVSGFRYTPRQNARSGRVRAWRFYLF